MERMTPSWLELKFIGPSREPTTMFPWDCPSNCSGRGDCLRRLCYCQIGYSGPSCENLNTAYFVTFGALFATLGLVALLQLLLCMQTDYKRGADGSVRSACEVTTQKLLYVLTVCAAAIRSAYFLSRWTASSAVASALMSAYYPFLITGFSLIICFWAEAFHVSSEINVKPRFLSKSAIAFIAFNVVIYLLLASELIITLGDKGDKSARTVQVYNALFAGCMLLMAVLFLVYGVEVYFKIRGAFRMQFESLNWLQLHMSRFGLISQSSLQITTTACLASSVLIELWDKSLPMLSLNLYELGFHVAEFGVILWFPCVLWNCTSPDQLWVLNPQLIFKHLPMSKDATAEPPRDCVDDRQVECWICYESRRPGEDDLIQPCACRGDVRAVHHECLRKWIVQSHDSAEPPMCKVCNQEYSMRQGMTSFSRGLTLRHWVQAAVGGVLFFGCPCVDYAVYRSSLSTTYQILVIGISTVIQIASIKVLCGVISDVYRRARLSGVQIEGEPVDPAPKLYVISDSAPLTGNC